MLQIQSQDIIGYCLKQMSEVVFEKAEHSVRLCRLPEARGEGSEDATFWCVEIQPPNMFTLNFHAHSFIFICQGPSPLPFETPFLLSVSPLLPIFEPFSAPPISLI